eukprot:3387444-Alexandrium_andersonii.AAC.1
MPARSASPELKAMVCCVDDKCLMTRRPRAAAPQNVEGWTRGGGTRGQRSSDTADPNSRS